MYKGVGWGRGGGGGGKVGLIVKINVELYTETR